MCLWGKIYYKPHSLPLRTCCYVTLSLDHYLSHCCDAEERTILPCICLAAVSDVEQHLGGLAEGGRKPGGPGDRKGLKGGTGGPGRVFGGGEKGAGLYSLFRAVAGPAAAGGDHPAHPPTHLNLAQAPFRSAPQSDLHVLAQRALGRSNERGGFIGNDWEFQAHCALA